MTGGEKQKGETWRRVVGGGACAFWRAERPNLATQGVLGCRRNKERRGLYAIAYELMRIKLRGGVCVKKRKRKSETFPSRRREILYEIVRR